MKAYQTLWRTTCALLAMVGVTAALLLSVPAMLVIYIAVAVTGGMMTVIFLHAGDTETPPPGLWRRCRTNAWVSGTVAVAAIGFTAALGAGVFLIMLLLAASSPYALRHSRGRGRPLPVAPGLARYWDEDKQAAPLEVNAGQPAIALLEPSSLNDAELCTAWRASFTVLQRASTLSQRLQVVELRQRYLDELERRNANGIAVWLASGARAAGNPTKFLVDRAGAGRATIEWNSLVDGSDP